ncbi:MAG: hypothetical protein IPK85_01985 [Gemmatimonadetes bacterium]|nr:hypothetical protein [Gemmatimonadota bacterium]
MTAETITREDIKRLRDVSHRQRDRAYLGAGSIIRGRYEALLDMAEAHLAEPARLAAARAEGVREGIEIAARYHEGKADVYRDNRAQFGFLHTSYAAEIRSLSPAPAPWTPTHRHYKGGLYREIERLPDRSDDGARPEGIVVYEGEDGGRHSIDARRFDGMVAAYALDGAVSPTGEYARRFEPINPAPAEAPKALTRCQAASLRNDGECSHPLCPVPHGSKGVARLVCTLPGVGDDYVDEDDLPPAEAPTTPACTVVVWDGHGDVPTPPILDEQMNLSAEDWRRIAEALPAPTVEASASVAEGLTVKTYDPETGRTSIRDRQPPGLPSGWVRGVQYLAKDGRGQWYYLNHDWTWQTCPPSDSPFEHIAALEAENKALRERGALVVQALDGPGANAQLLVSAVDGLRALLQGQGGADGR